MNDDNPPTPMRTPHGMNYSYANDEAPTLDTQLVVPQRDLLPVPPPNLENLSSDDKQSLIESVKRQTQSMMILHENGNRTYQE